MPSELMEYEGTVMKTTELALLIDVGGDEVWIPRSQLGEDGVICGDAEEGDEGTFMIPEWLAVEKGLE